MASIDQNMLAERTMSKVRRRILPLIFILYLIAFLDRANVAYAKLTMSADLGFSEAVYGFGAGLFFAGYLLLEIPGALIAQKWGARRWTARILLTWGICTIIVGTVKTANQFYLARLALGVAEAGFFPGVLVHINRWFPKRERARALALFLMASPIALAIGGPIAGLILKAHFFNLPGWRWVFIAEGIPAIIFSFLTLFLMTDWPHQAKWLHPEERDWLQGQLDEEKLQKTAQGHFTPLQALRHPTVLLLAAIIGLANIGIQGFFLWLPTTVQKASGLNPSLSAVVSGLPFAVAVIAVLVMSWSSDRTGERCFHTAIPLILSAFIFPITTLSGLSFGWLLFWLCVSSAAIYGFGPTFWVLPTITMGESAGAAALGFVNCFSGVGGFIGPTVVGAILTANHSYGVAVMFLSACFLAAGLLTLSMRGRISGHRKREAIAAAGGLPATAGRS